MIHFAQFLPDVVSPTHRVIRNEAGPLLVGRTVANGQNLGWPRSKKPQWPSCLWNVLHVPIDLQQEGTPGRQMKVTPTKDLLHEGGLSNAQSSMDTSFWSHACYAGSQVRRAHASPMVCSPGFGNQKVERISIKKDIFKRDQKNKKKQYAVQPFIANLPGPT